MNKLTNKQGSIVAEAYQHFKPIASAKKHLRSINNSSWLRNRNEKSHFEESIWPTLIDQEVWSNAALNIYQHHQVFKNTLYSLPLYMDTITLF